MLITRCSQFSYLIIGFINAGVLAIWQRFHMAKALTAHGYFRLFTSTPRGQGKQLHCAKLSRLLQFVSQGKGGCYVQSRQYECLLESMLFEKHRYLFFKYEILSI